MPEIRLSMYWCLALAIFYTWHNVYLGGRSTCFALWHRESLGAGSIFDKILTTDKDSSYHYNLWSYANYSYIHTFSSSSLRSCTIVVRRHALSSPQRSILRQIRNTIQWNAKSMEIIATDTASQGWRGLPGGPVTGIICTEFDTRSTELNLKYRMGRCSNARCWRTPSSYYTLCLEIIRPFYFCNNFFNTKPNFGNI